MKLVLVIKPVFVWTRPKIITDIKAQTRGIYCYYGPNPKLSQSINFFVKEVHENKFWEGWEPIRCSVESHS